MCPVGEEFCYGVGKRFVVACCGGFWLQADGSEEHCWASPILFGSSFAVVWSLVGKLGSSAIKGVSCESCAVGGSTWAQREAVRRGGGAAGLGRRRFEFFDVCEEFLFVGPALHVQTDHLISPQRRLLASPQTDQEADDDAAVGLDFDAHRVFTQ